MGKPVVQHCAPSAVASGLGKYSVLCTSRSPSCKIVFSERNSYKQVSPLAEASPTNLSARARLPKLCRQMNPAPTPPTTSSPAPDRKITIRIRRQDDPHHPPYWQEFVVPVLPQ